MLQGLQWLSYVREPKRLASRERIGARSYRFDRAEALGPDVTSYPAIFQVSSERGYPRLARRRFYNGLEPAGFLKSRIEKIKKQN